nr:hypothetical protein [Tanacetum cinerariifolium]
MLKTRPPRVMSSIENGLNILKSIDERPSQMGTVQETLAERTEGAPYLGPERPRVYYDLSPKEKERGLRNSNYDQLYAYLKQHEAHVNENKMMLDRFTQHTVDPLTLMSSVSHQQPYSQSFTTPPSTYVPPHLVDNAHLDSDDCDAFDSNVDEAPTAQTMFMANLSSADPVYDEAGPSYDSNILSEVYDHDHYQDVVCEHHEEHKMHENVQLNPVVDSHADYTSDSNMILYDQYVKDNVNTVVDNSLTAELATYKEQVELYERRARNKLNYMKDGPEVTSLKKDFKQKENKYLEDLLDMKSLKEKVEDRLFKQDQSLQTVYIMCRPKPYYNEPNKVAFGYKNPLCLTRANQIQPALYNGHEIIKNNHVPAIVYNTEDTLKIAEITRRKMNDKMKDPECVKHKVKIAPHDYSKEAKEGTVLLGLKICGLQGDYNCYQALSKEIKEMKDVFKELEAEVAQNVIDRKHDEIKQKNLLIANDNLIAECLSKEVFYVATISELNVSRFTKMHVANTIVEARYSVRNNPPTSAKDTPNFDTVFVIGKMQASLQGKDNVIKQLKTQISHLQETRSEAGRTLDFKALDSHITQLTEKVTVLQAQNDLFRAENGKIKQHYKELYDSIKIVCAKHIEQVMALITENVNLKAQILNNVNSISKDHVKPTVLTPCKYATDVKPVPPLIRNNREAHLNYLRHLKESVKTIHEIV